MGYESLHNHTTFSDGTQDHIESLKTAKQFGYSIIAFTDHDIVPDQSTLSRLKEYHGPMKWFLGCEISSGFPKEVGSGSMGSLHILGLGTDPKNKALLEHCDRANKTRIERTERMVNNLKNLGFKITTDDCFKEAGEGSVGRPHIVRALLRYPENAPIIEKLRQEMETASKNDPTLRIRYEEMIRQGYEQYPYTLFLSHDSFVRGVYVGYLYVIDMDQSVNIIRNAGGIAIIAHWGTVKDKIPEEVLKQFLEENRLDGVEIASMYTTSGIPERMEQTNTLRSMATSTESIMTIGADAHSKEDYKSFSQTNIIKESIGMTEKILKQRSQSAFEYTNLYQ